MFYRIEYCCTGFDASWLYAIGGIEGYIGSDNPWDWDEDCVFDNEEDARKAWEQYKEHYIWEDYDEDDLTVNITLYSLSRYDDDYKETVLELSTGVLTPKEIQEMFPRYDFERDMWKDIKECEE